MPGGRYTQNDSQKAARGDAVCSPLLPWPLVIIINVVISELNNDSDAVAKTLQRHFTLSCTGLINYSTFHFLAASFT